MGQYDINQCYGMDTISTITAVDLQGLYLCYRTTNNVSYVRNECYNVAVTVRDYDFIHYVLDI